MTDGLKTAAGSPMALSFTRFSDTTFHLPNPNSSSSSVCFLKPRSVKFTVLLSGKSVNRNSTIHSPAGFSPSPSESFYLRSTLLGLGVSALLFLGVGARFCSTASANVLPSILPRRTVQEQKIRDDQDVLKLENVEKLEELELKAAFERWKSKTYALTVPLKIIALRGSIPPSWMKEFMQSQGRRSKFYLQFRGSLEDIFFPLSRPFSKVNIDPKLSVASDLVSVGDSWLNFAIKNAMIEPIQGVENEDWFKGLNNKWKMYLCRNCKGELDPEGNVWAAPYRWGSMVIAYKKSKFQKYKLAPIEDWADLWRPELAGRISMVDSPREVVGAVLKYMGASYNTNNFESEVVGGRNAVMKNFSLLGSQVRLFDSMHYLKAFGVGDVWVAVGWSSDVIPTAKRMSNVVVVVPKSGASLWADLWAIPAVSSFNTNRTGGCVRGPSPLIHQWIELCLQDARALLFKQEVIPGASPSALEGGMVEMPLQLTKGKPKLETNLVAGVPPPEILSRKLPKLQKENILKRKWHEGCLHTRWTSSNEFYHKCRYEGGAVVERRLVGCKCVRVQHHVRCCCVENFGRRPCVVASRVVL